MDRRLLAALAAVLLAAALGGCTVRLISDYDEETDRAVIALHRQVEGLLTDLERHAGTEAGAYAAYRDRYDAIGVDLRSIWLRATSRPRNALQVAQLEEIGHQLALLEEAHAEGLAGAEVELFRRGFEQSFGAVSRLELAKKRGE